MKKLIEQMIKFGFVGFLCFFIDWGIMVFLTEVFGINPLISSTISFTVSVTVLRLYLRPIKMPIKAASS